MSAVELESTGEVTMLALLPTLFSLLAVAAPPTITPAEAAQHVGEEVVVRGKIEQIVTALTMTTHINFGGRYPDQVFTGKIFKASQGLFMGVKSYEGKVAEVQGVVRMYKGKPEIMISQPSQLRLAGASAQPAPASLGQATVAPSSSIADPRFDPQGADFAAWVGHFKAAVADQWSIPAGAAPGSKVDFEFVVERDGSMSAIRMLQSSGTASLDRAAANALEKSRFLPLPDAYPDKNVMMRVAFIYGGGTK
jgi:TonB family protein